MVVVGEEKYSTMECKLGGFRGLNFEGLMGERKMERLEGKLGYGPKIMWSREREREEVCVYATGQGT